MERRKSDFVNARQRKQRGEDRDIGEIPPVYDWRRRFSCEFDLEEFLLRYLPESFPIPFSGAHRRQLSRIEHVVLDGGRKLLPLPRGFGKSTIAEGAGLWALLYGHRKFFPIITAGDDSAINHMESIKTLLEISEPLFEDFPEVCHPVRALGGIPQRAGGLLYKGKRIGIRWSVDKLVLPTIPELDPERQQCRACGSVFTALGITSRRLRGLKHTRPDGVVIRPDFAFIDDPQTDESARNPAQVEKMMGVLTSAIFGMSGHGKSMSVLIACNVIARGDLIERLLDPDSPNNFEGERVPLVEKFPDELDGLWDQFRRILFDYNKALPGDVDRARGAATEFYTGNREAMDAGCVLTWPEAFDRELFVSGVHYAMVKYYTTPAESFASEYQNLPIDEARAEGQLTADDIAAKILPGMPRGAVPSFAEKLTAFVDVQGNSLFWLVAAWGEGFTGHVVDYGCYPEQKRRYFTVRDLPRTLSTAFPGKGREALWRAGLDALSEELLAREYERDDGAVMRIERLFPDANDGTAMDVVFEFCRNSRHPSVVMPYRSKGVRAGDRPFAEYANKPGDVVGLNWRIPGVKGRRVLRHMWADVNFWKSFVRERWRTAIGDPGSLTLFEGTNDYHRLFLDHMTSEYSVRTEGRGRTMDEWKIRPATTENHWWDCLVGAAVAASYAGCKMAEAGGPESRKQRKWKTLKEARALQGRA